MANKDMKRAASSRELESSIAQQNELIESLKEVLEEKQGKILSLEEDFKIIKVDAARQLKQMEKNSEKVKHLCDQEKEAIRIHYEKEIQKVRDSHKLEIVKWSLQETFFKKQVELLGERVEELYDRGVAHDSELDASRALFQNKMAELKKSSQYIPKNVSFEFKELSEQLAKSLTDEQTLRAELNCCIKSKDKLKEELKHVESTNSQLNEELNALKYKCDVLSHNLNEHSKSPDQIALIDKYHGVLINMNDKMKDLYRNICSLNDPLRNESLTITFNDNDSSGDEKNPQDVSCDYIVFNLEEKMRKCFEEIDQVSHFQSILIKENEFNAVRGASGNLTQTCLANNYESLKNDLDVARTHLRDFEIERGNLLQEKNILLNKIEYYEKNLKSGDTVNVDEHSFHSLPDKENSSMCTPPNSSAIFKCCGDIESNTPSNMVTSTPFAPKSQFAFQGGGESLEYIQNPSPTTTDHGSLMTWMEKCVSLDKDNKKLRNDILDCNIRIKKLEYEESLYKNDMLSLDKKISELNAQISDYHKLKSHINEMSQKNILLNSHLTHLKSKIETLELSKKTLFEENTKLLETAKNTVMNIPKTANCKFEEIIKALSERIEEEIDLKARIRVLEDRNDKLQKKNKCLTELKNLDALKIDQIHNELSQCKDELSSMIRENENLSVDNRVMSQQLNLSLLRIKFLESLRDNYWKSSASTDLVEEMYKQILSVSKEAIDRKQQLEKLLIDKTSANEQSHDLDARHRYELLLKSVNQLYTDKETYCLKFFELQEAFHNIEKGSGVDSGWITHIEKLQRDMLHEMSASKEQHARIEEALRSNGKLHDELQKGKDAIKVKIQEFCKLEKKLEEEKIHRKNLELKHKKLENELNEKALIIKNYASEVKILEDHFMKNQENPVKSEAWRNFELKNCEWKIQKAELAFSHSELESKLRASTEHSESVDYYVKIKNDVEKQYREALKKMEYYYNAHFNALIRQNQETHNTQLEKVNNLVKEQSLTIEKLTTKKLFNELSFTRPILPSSIDNYMHHLDTMDKCQKDIADFICTLGNDLKDSGILKRLQDTYDELFKAQLLVVCKVLKDEHKKQYDMSIKTLNELHVEEIKIQKLLYESNKFKVEDNVYFNAFSDPKVDVSRLFDEVQNCSNAEWNAESLSRSFLHAFLAQLRLFSKHWSTAYRKRFNDLQNELTEGISRYNTSTPKDHLAGIALNNEELLNNQKQMVDFARDFLSRLVELKESIVSDTNQVVSYFIQQTEEGLKEIKNEHYDSNKLVALKEEVQRLQTEKNELEQQVDKTLELLKSDHDSRVNNAKHLLSELKIFCETSSCANALQNLKTELELKHKQEVDELRKYFEQKCAQLEKNFSDEVFSQHSHKMSTCSEDTDKDFKVIDGSGDGPCESPTNDRFLHDEPANYYSLKDYTDHHSSPDINLIVKIIKDMIMADCEEEISRELSLLKEREKQLGAQNNIENANILLGNMRKGKGDTNYGGIPSRLEDFILNDLSEATVWKVINKVKCEMLENINHVLSSSVTQMMANLNRTISNKMSKINENISNQQEKLMKLENNLKTIKAKPFSRLLHKPGTPNELSTDDSGHISFNHGPEEISGVEQCLNNKLMSMMNSSRKDILNERNYIKSANEKKEELDLGTKSGNPSRTRESRFEPKKIISSLRTVSNQLADYIRDSEDELLQRISAELAEVCDHVDNDEEDISSVPERGVHFAPKIHEIIHEINETLSSDCLDLSSPNTSQFIDELKSCLGRLKGDATDLLGLSCQHRIKNESEIELLQKQNTHLLEELSKLKNKDSDECTTHVACGKLNECCLEAVYDDCSFMEQKLSLTCTYLRNKVNALVLGTDLPPKVVKSLEELAGEGDILIEKLQRERDDLQLQIKAADKRLQSTNIFLEEQTIERETECEQFTKEIASLRAQLKEMGKECSARERISREVLALDAQNSAPVIKKVEEVIEELNEQAARLSESQKNEEYYKSELRTAVEKIQTLREIISDLEIQLFKKAEVGEGLVKHITVLENELEFNSGNQRAMVEELESLRNQSLEGSCLDQIHQLQESIKINFNSSTVRQMKIQVKDCQNAIDRQTKELESLLIASTNNSMSSPSEEISLREQIENMERKTPEPCPSPVLLPTEDLTTLHEKIMRHCRSDEVVIKKLRDQDLRLSKLHSDFEDLQAERDVLQNQVDKQKGLIADLNNKMDGFRHRLGSQKAAANKEILDLNQALQEKLCLLEKEYDNLQAELCEKEFELEHAKEVIAVQQDKLASLTGYDEEAVDTLRLELAAVNAEKNKLEDLVEKFKRKEQNKSGLSIEEVNAILDDKNEDIEHLHQTVTSLQNQKDISKYNLSNSKGYRVSFAMDVSSASAPLDESKLRDAPVDRSFQIEVPSELDLSKEKDKSISEDIGKPPPIELTLRQSYSSSDSSKHSLEIQKTLEQSLDEKDEKITQLELELRKYERVEKDFHNCKTQLNFALDESEKYRKEVEAKEKMIESLEKTLTQKDAEIIKMSANLVALQKIADQVFEKLKAATALITDNGKSNEELKNVNHRLHVEQTVSESWKNKTEYLSNENETLKAELDVIKKEKDDKIKVLNEKLICIEKELNVAQQLIEKERNYVSDVTAQTTQLNKELSELRCKLSDANAHKDSACERLHLTENKLSEMTDLIVSLKNELVCQKGPIKIPSQVHFDHAELRFLEQEINKLISKLGLFEFERNTLQEELINYKQKTEKSLAEDLKAIQSKDLQIAQLHSHIEELQNVISKLKSINRRNSNKYKEEISNLQKDLSHYHGVEADVSKKLKEITLENANLISKLKSISENRRSDVAEAGIQCCGLPLRTRSNDPGALNQNPPVSDIEALSDQVRKQANLSTHLDNSLIEIADLPLSSVKGPAVAHHGEPTELHHAHAWERVLLNRVDSINNLRKQLILCENTLQEVSSSKLELEMEMKSLKRKVTSQEDRIKDLTNELDDSKNQRFILELSVNDERTFREHVETELNLEKEKVRSIQLSDLQLIESMRSRIDTFMRNETKLKQIAKEEFEKREEMEAQLNSMRVMERYLSESENDSDSKSTIQKLKEEHERIYKSMEVELNTEKRAYADLKSVLNRERETLISLQQKLKKIESSKPKNQDHEFSELFQALRNEQLTRLALEKQLKDLQVQLNSGGKSNQLINELEKECRILRKTISALEEERKLRKTTEKPILDEIDDLNKAVELLVSKRNNLNSAIDDLCREKQILKRQIQELTEERNKANSNSADLRLGPSMLSRLENYLSRFFRAESFRKALIVEKKYLTVALKGYQDCHVNTLYCLHPNYVGARKKRSFKIVALLVRAVLRMRYTVEKRKNDRYAAYVGVVKILGLKDVPHRLVDHSNGKTGLPHSVLGNSASALRRHHGRRTTAPRTGSRYLSALEEVQNYDSFMD